MHLLKFENLEKKPMWKKQKTKEKPVIHLLKILEKKPMWKNQKTKEKPMHQLSDLFLLFESILHDLGEFFVHCSMGLGAIFA